MKHSGESPVELRALLPETWHIQNERSSARPFSVLDSYNCILLASGTALIEFRESPPSVEFLPEMFREELDKPLPAKAFRPELLPCGKLRSAVEKKIGEWRLGVRTQGIETTERFRLENEDKKGVAHLLLRTLKSETGSSITAIEVHPYRGYEHEVAQVKNHLEAMHPLAAAVPAFLESLPDTIRFFSRPLPEIFHSDNARSAVLSLARYILARVRHYEPGVVEDNDPEVLHQYRVSIRRIRSLVALLKGVFLPTEQQTLKTQLKLAMQTTNRLRDLDVQISEVVALRSSLPDRLKTGFDHLLRRLQEDRKLAFNSVRIALVTTQFDERFALTAEVLDAQSDPLPETISDLLGPAMKKRYRGIVRKIASFEDSVPPEQLHGLRVSCKKLRYLMEFFPQLLDPDLAKPMLKDLKKLQTLLGQYNDLFVLEAFLMGQVEHHTEDSNALMAIGAVIMQSHEKRKRLAQRCIKEARAYGSNKRKRALGSALKGASD